MTTVKAKSEAPYFDYTATVDVDVEIDPDELHADGWHHQTECEVLPDVPAPPPPSLAAAVASLHRQAHPAQRPDPLLCREEPCRSIPCDLLGGAS